MITIRSNYIIFLRSFIRFLLVFINYPRAGLAFLFRIVGHIPGFRYRSKRDIISAKKFKKNGKLHNYQIGYATQKKSLYLDFFKICILKTEVNEGEELTAEHFYLNRSIADLKLLLDLSSTYLDLDKFSIILDPACGTGKHLQYIVDVFKCKGLGIDSYMPAITVANKANIGNDVKFICKSSLDINTIDKFIPDKINLIIINSWLGYVSHEKNFTYFIDKIMENSSFIMIISSINDDLRSMFRGSEFIVEHKIFNAQYVLLKTNNL